LLTLDTVSNGASICFPFSPQRAAAARSDAPLSARARGRKGGRREKLTRQQSHEIRVLMKDPAVQVANVARQYKVSRSTIYRVIADGNNPA